MERGTASAKTPRDAPRRDFRAASGELTMKTWGFGLRLIGSLSLALSASFFAQEGEKAPEAEQDPIAALGWKTGPTEATVGKMARIKLSEEYRALGMADTQKLMKMFGNVVDGSEVALVMPTANNDWFVVFEWDDCGYVKDDDKADLDADAIFKNMKDSEVGTNESRRKQGLQTQELLRWAIRPRYDEATKNLEWALVARFEGTPGEVVNLQTRRLGRKGMMRVVLVCDPDKLDATLPPFRAVMSGFSFLEEEAYASYKQGDKVADYTLGAIVGGGALAIAAKAGFLKKFWKFLVFGVLAIGGAIGKFFKRFKGAKQC